MKHLLTIVLTLTLLTCCTTPARREAMRHGLDSINVRNRTDQPFTTDDVQPYVDFFDRHGTANDRLLAHYLMGRAYHEQGEAPTALQRYQQAIECADTTAADCDFAQLSRVYAQMEALFYEQRLYKEQLYAINQSVKYARIAKDTLVELIEYEQKASAYEELNMIDSAIQVSEYVAEQFSKYGYENDAAITLGGISGKIIEQRNTAKARKYMNIYEAKSGRFDSLGNIEQGREVYYFYKGLLYLYEMNLDSAEYWFRKELADGKDINNQNAAYRGLSLVFNEKHQTDSTAKYALRNYLLIDSLYNQTSTAEVKNIQSMYNYSRHQAIAQRAELKANEEINKRIWLAIVSTFAIILLYIVVFTIQHKRKLEHKKYEGCLNIIEQNQNDIIVLRSHESAYMELIAQKEELIEEQKKILKNHRMEKQDYDLTMAETRLMKSKYYQNITLLANKGNQPSEAEWQNIHKLVIDVFPNFYDFLTSKKHALNFNEYNTCILIRLHIKPTAICNMIGKSKSYITKIRIGLLNKLFNEEGSAQDFDQKILKMY